MKDLDFDELDQAVSSVLGNDTTAPATPVAPTPQVPADPAPALTPAPAATPAAPKPATASPAVRRRGQFLDMVHPTSNMTSPAPAATPPSAARKKLAPVSDNVTPAPTPEAVPASVPVAEATPPSALDAPSSDTDKAPAPETTWPDPLDLMPATPATDEADTATVPEQNPPVPEPGDAEEPATTPFVSDAKVDKRPLDAFATTDAAADEDKTEPKEDSAAAPEPSQASNETKELQQKPPIIDTTPPELQPDVVSVESDAGNELSDSVAQVDTMPTAAPEPPSKPAETGLTQSIPQQYKTPADASNKDQTPHPIFDTQEYHQPLLPAASKKSRSWIVVVVIVLLLVVGAALGYFAYMAGL